MDYDYFTDVKRAFPDERIELWCGDRRLARRIHWDDLAELVNRLIEWDDSWGEPRILKAWREWAAYVVLARIAALSMGHLGDGFVPVDRPAPDGTRWRFKINPVEPEKKE